MGILVDVSPRLLVGIRKCQNILRQYDAGTYLHCQKVAQISLLLGRLLELDAVSCQCVFLGASIHDLGKTAIPPGILRKSTSLTPEEWTIIQEHPRRGRDIAGYIMRNVLAAERKVVLDIIEYHHERPNGDGYPYGLTDPEIPWVAKVVAVADALDAMISHRPYRPKPKTLGQALKELQVNSGGQFDAVVVGKLVSFFTNCCYTDEC